MNILVKNKVKAYLRTFENLPKEAKQKAINEVPESLILYTKNVFGLGPIYQQAGLIYLRTLRKMANKKIEHSERAHALLSASGASRWLNCTPSPRLEEGFKNESSSFAEEGTLAHEFAELILKRVLTRITWGGYEKQSNILCSNKYYTPDMIDFVDIHINYVLEQFEAAKKRDKHAILLIEERVDITHLIEEGFGTCDVIIIASGVMEVIDLKYGLGVRVDATENAQLKLYGAGALEAYDFKYDIQTVILTVTQPRMDSISSWEISAADLIAWGEEVVKPKALIAYEGEGEQITGDWCKFCKASARCKAQNDLALVAAQKAFTDPQLLSDDELVEVYAKLANVGKWFASVAEYMCKEAMQGKKWKGLKVVDGMNRRGWTDEIQVQEKLEGEYKMEQFTTTKLKGIGDIEKLVGKKNFPIIFEDLVENKRTSPSLVLESDKRPAMEAPDYFGEDLEEI